MTCLQTGTPAAACTALSPAEREQPSPRLQQPRHPPSSLMSSSIVPRTGDRLACRPDASSAVIQNLGGSGLGPLAPLDPEDPELQLIFQNAVPQYQAEPHCFPDFADECTFVRAAAAVGVPPAIRDLQHNKPCMAAPLTEAEIASMQARTSMPTVFRAGKTIREL